jgi:hypothetical protein
MRGDEPGESLFVDDSMPVDLVHGPVDDAAADDRQLRSGFHGHDFFLPPRGLLADQPRLLGGGQQARDRPDPLGLVRRDGGSITAARRAVHGKKVSRDGDVAELTDYLSTASISHDRAQDQVHTVLTRRWDAVERIAARLRAAETVPARVLRSLT